MTAGGLPQNDRYLSWGRVEKPTQEIFRLETRNADLPQMSADRKFLPFGNGRSYGDSCLNDGGALIDMRSLDHLIHLDRDAGRLTCEAGVLFSELLDFLVPRGFFLPVTPGTKFITVGGAIANDIHGKNHHRAGNFGHHVLRFELLRSDHSRRICSPAENPELFFATIGGMGLTGTITWAEFNVPKIETPVIYQETIKTDGLSDFFSLSRESETGFEYTVSWVDCLAKGKNIGRGHFIRGNHAKDEELNGFKARAPKALTVPFNFPNHTLNRATLNAFNFAYYHRQHDKEKNTLVHYDPFFYPLDSVQGWNKIYGARGFYQYQCVVPDETDAPIREILERISKSGTGSFLGVLKTFGKIPSIGMMSFPRAGVTLALDFPNEGEKTLKLFSDLDQVVLQARGVLYPAKDGRIPREVYRQNYPRLGEFKEWVDPGHSSNFWRRIQ